jgi:hypothetical protein
MASVVMQLITRYRISNWEITVVTTEPLEVGHGMQFIPVTSVKISRMPRQLTYLAPVLDLFYIRRVIQETSECDETLQLVMYSNNTLSL